MLTLTNRIDMRPGAVPLIIHLGQYDSDFSLVFELYSSAGNFTVESGTTAMIRGTKTDGNAYDADATIDVSAKTVTVAGSEQMTAAKGRNVYELVLTKSGKVLSTANFILDVERAAMDADTIASESVLKELNAIIDSAATSTQAAADAASAADRAEDAAESVSSASAQIATNTADIADLKADLSDLAEIVDDIEPGLSEEAKAALLACLRGVAWVSQDSQTLYDNLENALNTTAKVLSISAVFEQGSAVIYPEDTLDNLRSFLTVTATLDNGKTLPVLNYDLSGQLTVGTSVITVTYKSKTTTFNVVVGEPEWGSDYTWLYRPSENGLLSEDENVSAMTAINDIFGTETLSGDVLNITAPYTGNASSGNIYKLIPITCTNAVLKAKVKFNSLAESSFPSGLRMQLSNGTKGAQIFVSKYTEGNYRISTHNEGDQVKLADIQLNRWYILSCEIKPNNTQTLKIDDAVYNINALASYANTESRVIVQQPGGATDAGNVDVDIAWIAFKNNA